MTGSLDTVMHIFKSKGVIALIILVVYINGITKCTLLAAFISMRGPDDYFNSVTFSATRILRGSRYEL